MIAAPQVAVVAQTSRLSGAAIRDTVTAVFRGAEFNRSSPIERFIEWLAFQFHRFWDALPAVKSPVLTTAFRLVVVGIAIAVILRVAYAIIVEPRSVDAAARRETGGRGGPARDPLAVADDAAARGDYTAAAHALYAALLQAISRRERVRLHPSKTVGDYVRDLRAKSSALFGRFRDFARSYEVVIYGVGVCDRDRYERLYALAEQILRPDGKLVA
ncbi:MAG: DUF4129 domain-containing protein [Gemmatimonadaceae bacterium]